MSYRDNPPPTFRCGHARSPENTRVNGRNKECRTCYRAYENEYRKRTNRRQKDQIRVLKRKLNLT